MTASWANTIHTVRAQPRDDEGSERSCQHNPYRIRAQPRDDEGSERSCHQNSYRIRA